jgi:hypothetical protein
MKLRKPNKPETRLRQRQQPLGGQLAPSLRYHSRRSDQVTSVGRNIDRDTLLKPAKSFGKYWLQRYGLLLVLIATAIFIFSSLSVSSNPRIIVEGTDQALFVTDQAEYSKTVTALINQSIWNRNKITINTSAIVAALKQQHPEIQSASVVLPLVARRPLIYVEPAQPGLNLLTASGDYVIDTTGKALVPAANTTASSAALPQVTDLSGLTIILGQQTLSAADVTFIQAVYDGLQAKSIAISKMTLPAQSQELDVYIGGQPYFVKFNLESQDVRQQLGTFLAVQSHLDSQHITPTQYIDVRVDGRAYYL